MRMGSERPHFNGTRHEKAYQKVEFSTLEHFLDEVTDSGIRLVRLDLFEQSSPSELQFIYYVRLLVCVTALDDTGFILFEYKETIATSAQASPDYVDAEGIQQAHNLRQALEQQVSARGLQVRRGRFAFPLGRDGAENGA